MVFSANELIGSVSFISASVTHEGWVVASGVLVILALLLLVAGLVCGLLAHCCWLGSPVLVTVACVLAIIAGKCV